MPASETDGTLSWVAKMNNDDYKAKLEENIRLTQQWMIAANNAGQRVEDMLTGRRSSGSGQTNAAISETANNLTNVEGLAQKAAVAVGSFLSIQAAKNFVSELINVRGEFEQIEISYSTILKSKPAADKLLADAKNLAVTTPFSFQEIATSGKQLLAYGVDAKDVIGTIRTLGDVAAGVSAPLGDIAYLYGTLKTQGRAYAQDIRQFTGRGIPIIAELAKQFQVTESTVSSLVEQGKVGFPEVEKAIKSMTSAGGQFYNLTEAQSKSLTGQLSNLKDAFQFMLNDLGKANEGILSSGIAGAATVVENYQKVLDILGELIAVYGAYRAALLAEVAVTSIATLATEGYTTAQILGAGATAVATAAVTLLNAAMAAMPTVALTAAIAALSLVVYGLTASFDAAKESQEKLNEINQEGTKSARSQTSQLTSLDKVLRNSNNTEAVRLAAVGKIRDLMKERLVQYTDEQILAGKAEQSIRSYSAELIKNTKVMSAQKKAFELQDTLTGLDYKGNGNNKESLDAAYSAVPERFKVNYGLKNIGKFFGYSQEEKDKAHKATVDAYTSFVNDQLKGILKVYDKGIDDLNTGIDTKTDKAGADALAKAKRFEDLLKVDPVKNFDTLLKTASNKTDLEKIKTALSDRLGAILPTNAQFKTIEAKQKQLELVLTQYSPSTGVKAANAAATEFKKRQAIYDKLGDLYKETLSNAKTANDQEVDAVKEKYEKLLRLADEYNKTAKIKVDPTKLNFDAAGRVVAGPVKGGQTVNVKDQEDKAIADVKAKQAVEDSKKNIDAQKQIFDQFEQYKLEFGEAQAKERFGEELKGYKTYIDYLDGLMPNKDDLSAAANAMREFLGKEKPKAQKEASKAEFDQQTKELKAVLEQTQTAATERLRIETQYQKDLATLTSDPKISNEEFQARLQNLTDKKNADLNATKQIALAQSAIYKEAMKDVTNASLAELNQRIKDAKRQIDTADLPPEQRKLAVAKRNNAESELNAQSYHHDQFGQLIDDEDQVARKAREIQAYAEAVSSTFHELGEALAPFNEGLGDTLNTIGDIAGVAGTAAGSIASFASGDIVGGIQKGISAIAGVFKIFGAAKESAKKAAAELQKFQDDLLKGELAYNQLMRERAISQQDITKLTTQELKARQEMLKTQTSSAQSDYDKLLAKIKSEGQQITGSTTQKYGGFLGIGTKTRVVQSLGGVSSADYDELEKLYTQGQLTDATKQWFEELKKVKDQMGDITDAAKAAKDQLDQIATGTTADQMASAIFEGLKKGFRNIDDFLDDSSAQFANVIRAGIDSGFEKNYLQGKINDFYKIYADAAENGDLEDPAKVAALKAQYAKVIADAGKVYDQQTKVFGASASAASSANSLAGAVKGITQDQANILSGTLNGMRVAYIQTNQLLTDMNGTQLKYLQMGMENLRIFNLIELNTRQTAANTKDTVAALVDSVTELKGINNNTKDSLSVSMRAAGRFNY